MGIIKQTAISFIIGTLLIGGSLSSNQAIRQWSERVEMLVSADYTQGGLEQACTRAVQTAAGMKEKAWKAMRYTEEVLANCQQNVYNEQVD